MSGVTPLGGSTAPFLALNWFTTTVTSSFGDFLTNMFLVFSPEDTIDVQHIKTSLGNGLKTLSFLHCI